MTNNFEDYHSVAKDDVIMETCLDIMALNTMIMYLHVTLWL